MTVLTWVGLLLLVVTARPAAAQENSATPKVAIEATAGYAGFVDDATIDHVLSGVTPRLYVAPRLSVGPEVVFMRGPGADRDVFLTANLTYDLTAPRPGAATPVTPFLVAGGGVMWHQTRVGSGVFRSTEGAVTGGGGLRVGVSERVWLGAEARLGWELHYRVAATIGVAISFASPRGNSLKRHE